jgi:hypothetical protein
MTPRKIFMAAVAIALLLVGASLLVLDRMDRTPGRGEGGATPQSADPVAGAASTPGVGSTPAPTEAPAEPPPMVTEPTIGARPSAASSIPWDEVPMASKLGELGPGLAAPVNTALRAARATIESCFEEDRQLRASRPAPVVDPDNVPTGPAVLVLQLESRGGALDVVAATVESLGTSTRELANCACQVLRGWPIPAPAASPGRRYRLKYPLH